MAILFGDSMRSTTVQYSGLGETRWTRSRHALSGEPRARVAWRFGVGCDEGRATPADVLLERKERRLDPAATGASVSWSVPASPAACHTSHSQCPQRRRLQVSFQRTRHLLFVEHGGDHDQRRRPRRAGQARTEHAEQYCKLHHVRNDRLTRGHRRHADVQIKRPARPGDIHHHIQEQEPHKGAAREKASLEKHHATAKTVEQVLTPRLMELLSSREHTPPDPAEIAAVHSSLESLQSTLGAAYMLLAAEAKAETLHAELSEARGDLAYTLGSSEELVQAHERCVNDYAALKAVVERAREDAEALGRALQREGKVWGGGSGGGVGSAGVSTATKRLCTTLLETVGSSMTLNEAAGPGVEDASSSSSSLGGANESAGAAKSATTATGGEAAAGSGASPVPSAAERLRRQLEEAEAHQRSVAAQLHSRESQLALVRQELLNAEGERGRYADIISDASAKLAQAAGTPGDRTSRSVARRSEEADRLCEEEEKGLDEILSLCTRAATEWHAAENVHDAPPLADGFLVRGGAGGGGGGGGSHNIGNEENVSGGGQQLQLQASSKRKGNITIKASSGAAAVVSTGDSLARLRCAKCSV